MAWCPKNFLKQTLNSRNSSRPPLGSLGPQAPSPPTSCHYSQTIKLPPRHRTRPTTALSGSFSVFGAKKSKRSGPSRSSMTLLSCREGTPYGPKEMQICTYVVGCPSVCLPAWLAVCLSACLPVGLSVCLLPVGLSVCLPVCRSVGPSVRLSVCPSVRLSVCPSARLPGCRSAGLPVCRSAGRSVGRSVCLSVSLSLSLCLSVCLSD